MVLRADRVCRAFGFTGLIGLTGLVSMSREPPYPKIAFFSLKSSTLNLNPTPSTSTLLPRVLKREGSELVGGPLRGGCNSDLAHPDSRSAHRREQRKRLADGSGGQGAGFRV